MSSSCEDVRSRFHESTKRATVRAGEERPLGAVVSEHCQGKGIKLDEPTERGEGGSDAAVDGAFPRNEKRRYSPV